VSDVECRLFSTADTEVGRYANAKAALAGLSAP